MQTLVLVHTNTVVPVALWPSLYIIFSQEDPPPSPKQSEQSGLFIQALISVFETLTMFKMDKL